MPLAPGVVAEGPFKGFPIKVTPLFPIGLESSLLSRGLSLQRPLPICCASNAQRTYCTLLTLALFTAARRKTTWVAEPLLQTGDSSLWLGHLTPRAARGRVHDENWQEFGHLCTPRKKSYPNSCMAGLSVAFVQQQTETLISPVRAASKAFGVPLCRRAAVGEVIGWGTS